MKSRMVFGAVLLVAFTTVAQEKVASYDWQELARGGKLAGGVVVSSGAGLMLEISNTNATPLRVHILTIEKPAIKKSYYAISGEVKYQDVSGEGYIEMWNHFPAAKPGAAEPAYFSRTLGEGGEMGKLTGSSDWRSFKLPFDGSGVDARPTRLELNVYLPGKGTVWLRPIDLTEYSEGFGASAGPAHAWWQDREAGLIGGISGALIGCLGSLLAWLAAKGKSRTFVLTTSLVLECVGAICCMAGVIAIVLHQPYGVWFPLLLVGILLLGIFPVRRRRFQRHYEDLEIRRMSAMDAS